MNNKKLETQYPYLVLCAALFEGVTAFFSRSPLGCAVQGVAGAALASVLAYAVACFLPLGYGEERGNAQLFLSLYFLISAAHIGQVAVLFFVASQQQLRGSQVHIFLFFAVVFYGVYLGEQALMRSALPVFAAGVLLFIVCIFISPAPQMNPQNLAPAVNYHGVFSYAAAHLTSPALFIAHRYNSVREKAERGGLPLFKIAMFQYVLVCVLIIVCNLVLGGFAAQSRRPVLFLLEAGSFFGEMRFDVFFAAAIFICGVLEAAFFAHSAGGILQQRYPQIKNKTLYASLAVLCTLLAGGMQSIAVNARAGVLLLVGFLAALAMRVSRRSAKSEKDL